MTNEHIRSLLPDYAAGMLSEKERHEVERALAADADLRAELEHIRAVFDAFPADRIRNEMARRSQSIGVAAIERSRVMQHSHGRWWYWLLGGAIATAALLGVIFHHLPPSSIPFNATREPRTLPVGVLNDSSPHSRTHSTTIVWTTPSSGSITHSRYSVPPSDIPDDVDYDALTIATFPDTELDSAFVEQFIEVFSDGSAE